MRDKYNNKKFNSERESKKPINKETREKIDRTPNNEE